MHHDYHDIRDHIEASPDWFDENGVPRWGVFEPGATADVYAREAVLLAVECQACACSFKVCMTSSAYEEALGGRTLEERIREREIHYGDPPNIDCCPAGPTMNSVPKRVLEFWRREHVEWARVPDLETDVEPAWAGESENEEQTDG